MPPACPADAYARRYRPANLLAPDEHRRDPTRRGAVVFPLALQVRVNRRCCASQWYTTAGRSGSPDRESPPGKPVASGRLAGRRVAMSVSHHRASRWHRRDGSAPAGWHGRKAVKRVAPALPVPSLGLLRRWIPLASRESAEGPRAAALQAGRGRLAIRSLANAICARSACGTSRQEATLTRAFGEPGFLGAASQ